MLTVAELLYSAVLPSLFNGISAAETVAVSNIAAAIAVAMEAIFFIIITSFFN